MVTMQVQEMTQEEVEKAADALIGENVEQVRAAIEAVKTMADPWRGVVDMQQFRESVGRKVREAVVTLVAEHAKASAAKASNPRIVSFGSSGTAHWGNLSIRAEREGDSSRITLSFSLLLKVAELKASAD